LRDAMRGRIAIIANGMLRVTHISCPLIASPPQIIRVVCVGVLEIYVIIVGMSNPRDLANVWLVGIGGRIIAGVFNRADKVVRVVAKLRRDGRVVLEVGVTQKAATIGIGERPLRTVASGLEPGLRAVSGEGQG